MASIGMRAATIADVAKRLDPDGKIDTIVELLTQTNEVLDDMLFLEGNLPTGHRTTIRSGLPSVAWRMLNYGVQPSKSRTKQVTDTTGMLEGYAEVDKALAQLNNNTAEFRLSEDRAFLDAMNNAMAETLFYGDTDKNPERFLGLSARFSVKDATKADNGVNVIDMGGTGTGCTSIWLTAWGDNTIHGIFPKGSKAGFEHHDLGEQTLQDGTGGNYQGYRTHYKWDLGLVVRDWRYVVRIANIKASDLKTLDLITAMMEATELLPSSSLGRPVFYMNKTVRTALRAQIMNKENVHLTVDSVAGKQVLAFDGIPVRRCDALSLEEKAI